MSDVKSLDKYNMIILSKSPNITQVSRLYSLNPIGVGTPYTESISSYLTRLAQEHCVTPKKLIMGEIAPLILVINISQKCYLRMSVLFSAIAMLNQLSTE